MRTFGSFGNQTFCKVLLSYKCSILLTSLYFLIQILLFDPTHFPDMTGGRVIQRSIQPKEVVYFKVESIKQVAAPEVRKYPWKSVSEVTTKIYVFIAFSSLTEDFQSVIALTVNNFRSYSHRYLRFFFRTHHLHTLIR